MWSLKKIRRVFHIEFPIWNQSSRSTLLQQYSENMSSPSFSNTSTFVKVQKYSMEKYFGLPRVQLSLASHALIYFQDISNFLNLLRASLFRIISIHFTLLSIFYQDVVFRSSKIPIIRLRTTLTTVGPSC